MPDNEVWYTCVLSGRCSRSPGVTSRGWGLDPLRRVRQNREIAAIITNGVAETTKSITAIVAMLRSLSLIFQRKEMPKEGQRAIRVTREVSVAKQVMKITEPELL